MCLGPINPRREYDPLTGLFSCEPFNLGHQCATDSCAAKVTIDHQGLDHQVEPFFDGWPLKAMGEAHNNILMSCNNEMVERILRDLFQMHFHSRRIRIIAKLFIKPGKTFNI